MNEYYPHSPTFVCQQSSRSSTVVVDRWMDGWMDRQNTVATFQKRVAHWFIHTRQAQLPPSRKWWHAASAAFSLCCLSCTASVLLCARSLARVCLSSSYSSSAALHHGLSSRGFVERCCHQQQLSMHCSSRTAIGESPLPLLGSFFFLLFLASRGFSFFLLHVGHGWGKFFLFGFLSTWFHVSSLHHQSFSGEQDTYIPPSCGTLRLQMSLTQLFGALGCEEYIRVCASTVYVHLLHHQKKMTDFSGCFKCRL